MIPGVGKKTAERIALELKDRLVALTRVAAPAPAPSVRDDVVSALLNLEYHRAAVEKAVDAALAENPADSFEAALRSSLKRLSR